MLLLPIADLLISHQHLPARFLVPGVVAECCACPRSELLHGLSRLSQFAHLLVLSVCSGHSTATGCPTAAVAVAAVAAAVLPPVLRVAAVLHQMV